MPKKENEMKRKCFITDRIKIIQEIGDFGKICTRVFNSSLFATFLAECVLAVASTFKFSAALSPNLFDTRLPM